MLDAAPAQMEVMEVDALTTKNSVLTQYWGGARRCYACDSVSHEGDGLGENLGHERRPASLCVQRRDHTAAHAVETSPGVTLFSNTLKIERAFSGIA